MNRIGVEVSRIQRIQEDDWPAAIAALPDEEAFPGLSDITLKEKVTEQLDLVKKSRRALEPVKPISSRTIKGARTQKLFCEELLKPKRYKRN